MQKRIALVTSLIFTLSIFAACQGKPSPPASASCDLGAGKTVKTDYSSPRMKGRKIYGDLVPFGEVWRTGANEATTFVASSDVTVGGKAVPAGSYTIFTVPTADKWTLIAVASRPGPLANSVSRVVPRRRCITDIPSSGSNARSSTPAPMPRRSAATLHI